MTFQRVEKSNAWSPQTPQKTSSFAPRSFAIQAQQAAGTPPTQDRIENEAFEQDKVEATRLQMKQESGAIALRVGV